MASNADDIRSLISVRNIEFSFGTTKVLDDVTFDVICGDFLALIGPNGSGKTTLIKIILGLLKPNRGTVFLLDQEAAGFTQWSKLGYVPQKATHFDPYFPVSVEEVVSMGLLSVKSFPRPSSEEDKELIEEALRNVGMEDYRRHRIGSLSGGQQQRVFIARAVVNKPEILILDEPTTGVDALTQEHFYDMLHELNNKKEITIILVTHEIGIINRHINKVACLNQRLVYHGSHDEFCRTPAFRKMLSDGHHIISHRH